MKIRLAIPQQVVWAVLAALVGFAGPAAAEPPPPREWDLGLGVYGWVTATDLEIDAGHSARGFGDAFDDWNGGGGGYLDFRYLRFVGLIDAAWVQADYHSKGWLTNTIGDLKFGFRVLDMNRPYSDSSELDAPRFTLDLLAGARYRNLEADVSGPNNNANSNWWDPVVGLRAGVGLMRNLTFSTVTDFGGFGVGSANDFSWSINPKLNYRAFDHLDLFVGWKYLYENRNHGGIDHQGLNGPQVGIGYSF